MVNIFKRGNNLIRRSQPHPIAGAEPESCTGNKKGGDPDKRETQLPSPWTTNHDFHLVLVIWETHFKFSSFYTLASSIFAIDGQMLTNVVCNLQLKSNTEADLDSGTHFHDTRS